MHRKQFIKASALAAIGSSLSSEAAAEFFVRMGKKTNPEIQTAADLDRYLKSLVAIEQPSVDRIIVGDPDTRIRKIGTCWMPYWSTLEKAASMGINVLIAHEPTFYTHMDLDESKNDYLGAPEHARMQYLNLVDRKKKWILENKMVVIRCHDVIDKMSAIGMPYALGNILGFTEDDIIKKTTFYNVYQTKMRRAVDVAQQFASKLKQLNQPGIAFYGNKDHMVSTVGIGTGFICDPLQFSSLEPDISVAISDTVRTWIHGAYARDSGKPLIVIDHGTSEENGMKLLGELLRKQLPGFDTIHIPEGCSYTWIS